MRLFLAYTLDENILQLINNISDSLKLELSKIKNFKANYVGKEQMHITMKFFEDEEPEKIINLLNEPDYNFSTEKNIFYFEKLDYFPDINNPKVIVLKVKDLQKILLNNFNQIEMLLEKGGINKDTRKFNPHLTLARIKYCNYGCLASFKESKILNITDEKKISFYGSKLKLIQSILTPQKPIYKEIHRF